MKKVVHFVLCLYIVCVFGGVVCCVSLLCVRLIFCCYVLCVFVDLNLFCVVSSALCALLNCVLV